MYSHFHKFVWSIHFHYASVLIHLGGGIEVTAHCSTLKETVVPVRYQMAIKEVGWETGGGAAGRERNLRAAGYTI